MSNVVKAVSHPLKSLGHLAKNPSKALLNNHIRTSSFYKNVGKPAIKIGAGIGLGALTGGLGSAAMFSTAGGLAGGLTAAANGGLTSSGFTPMNNVVMPSIAGYTAGHSVAGRAFDNARTAGLTLPESAQVAWNAGTTGMTLGGTAQGLGQLATLYGGLTGGQQQPQQQQPQYIGLGGNGSGLASSLSPAGGDQNQTLQRHVLNMQPSDVPQITGLGG